ncbi:hypothetical protein AALA80_19610 [Oscillospiraceae bacterium 50-60]
MTPKMQKALAALLTQPTKEKAAAAAGITSKTLRIIWMMWSFRPNIEKRLMDW